MIQNKFTFGQWVKSNKTGKLFKISGISSHPEHRYIYGSGDGEASIEDDLDSIDDKKLYAYIFKYSCGGEEVKFFKEDAGERWGAWTRLPDYDIEYEKKP